MMTVAEGKAALADFMAELVRTRAERDYLETELARTKLEVDYYRRALAAVDGKALSARVIEAIDQESLPTG